MSFQEIAITIRAVNRASHEFARVSADAESMAARVRSMGAAVSGLGATTSVIAHLGRQFGLLSDEQSRVIASTGYLITVFGMFLRTTWGVAAAQKVYTVATMISAKVTWVFNAALAHENRFANAWCRLDRCNCGVHGLVSFHDPRRSRGSDGI